MSKRTKDWLRCDGNLTFSDLCYAIAGLLLVCVLLAVSGCTTKTVYVPRDVFVPVPVAAPKPPDFDKPRLPIADLTEASAPDFVMKAYVATVDILKSMVEDRDKALDVYRKAPQTNTPLTPQGASK